MALSTVVKHSFTSGSIIVSDGTGTPLTVTTQFDQADFSVSGLKDKLKDTTAYQSRGTLHSVRYTSRVFPTLSFSAMVSEFSETSSGTLIDMITGKSGTPYAARVSTLGSTADVMTFDVKLTIEASDFEAGTSDLSLICEDVELSFDFAEGDPDTISISGVVYGNVTGDLDITS